MSNRRRARPVVGGLARRRPALPSLQTPRAAAPAVDDPLNDLIVRLMGCCAGHCDWPALRWYLRHDLADAARLVVVPVCPQHFDQADREVCPTGHGEGPCLASPDDPHFAATPDQIVAAVVAAFERGHGVAVPERDDWTRLDVLRPLAATS